MIIHTVVTSLAPLQIHQQRRGGKGKRAIPPALPPDMLSGGGRQVLASYTEFSYQGNFSDVACRLMDTLPHQSPAVGVSQESKARDSSCCISNHVAYFVRSTKSYTTPELLRMAVLHRSSSSIHYTAVISHNNVQQRRRAFFSSSNFDLSSCFPNWLKSWVVSTYILLECS